jgi:hypothetical protein
VHTHGILVCLMSVLGTYFQHEFLSTLFLD